MSNLTQNLEAIIDQSDLWIYGIRVLHADQKPEAGDTMDSSYVWDDGTPTDEAIGGTCCFICRERRDGYDVESALALAKKYVITTPARYALIGGKSTGNNDLIAEPHTVAIRDASVLAVWGADACQ